MYGRKLAFIALVAGIAALGGPEQVQAQTYGGLVFTPRHHSGFYAGGYVPGRYSVSTYYGAPMGIAPGYANTYGMSTGYYGIGTSGYGTSYGIGSYSPIIGAPYPVYGTTTTIIRGGPTGGVAQYTNNGNGYTYTSDSTYPTVIQQQPTLGLSRTFVPPSPPPVVIESRPQNSAYGVSTAPVLQQPLGSTYRGQGTIKLVCPKTAGGPLNYSLNGHAYTIQPGYSQSFREDRAWTLEFLRGGEGSDVGRYSLKAGTYTFAIGANGWELQQPNETPTRDLPPAPLPDTSTTSPLPDLSPTPSLPPSPLPPP